MMFSAYICRGAPGDDQGGEREGIKDGHGHHDSTVLFGYENLEMDQFCWVMAPHFITVSWYLRV